MTKENLSPAQVEPFPCRLTALGLVVTNADNHMNHVTSSQRIMDSQ